MHVVAACLHSGHDHAKAHIVVCPQSGWASPVVCFALDPLEMLSCPVVLFSGPWRVCAGGRWEANQVGFLPSSVFLLTGNSPWSFEARPRVTGGRFPRGLVLVRGIDGEQPASMGRKWVGLAGDRPRCSCGEICCACFAVLALLCLSRALDPWCRSSWLLVSLRSGCLAYPVPGGPSP